MAGEDLGADWGNDPTPAGNGTRRKSYRSREVGDLDNYLRTGRAPAGEDLGADWGNDTVPAAAKPAAAPADSSSLTWSDVLSPRNAQAQREGVGRPGRMLASAEDALTLPLRAVAGVGNALGQVASQWTGTPSGSFQGTGQAFKEGMAHPVQATQQNLQAAGVRPGFMHGVAMGPAATAESPLSLPSFVAGGAPAGVTGLLRQALTSPMGGGTALSAAGAGLRKAEYLTGLGSDPTTLQPSDFVPMGVGAGLAGIAKVASLGPLVREQAVGLIRRAGKPSTDPEVLKAGTDFMLGQGMLPEVVRGAWLPEGIAQNFRARMAPLAKEVGIQERLADDAGIKVNMDQAMEDAARYMAGLKNSRRLTLSPEEHTQSLDWARSRALVPDAEMQVRLDAANTPYEGRTVPLIGKEDVYQTVRGKPVLDAKGRQVLDANLQPVYEQVPRLSGQRDVIAGYQKLPDYLQPVPDIELPVSTSGNIKRGMQKVAYENDPATTAPKAGRVAAAKGTEQGIRSQLWDKAPDVARATEKVAPYYGAEPYFESIERRANNYHGTPWEFWRMGHIKGAQGLWGASSLLDAYAQAIMGGMPGYAPPTASPSGALAGPAASQPTQKGRAPRLR